MKPDETPSPGASPVRLQLRISSGPVSPRYQYWFCVDLEARDSGARITTSLQKPGRPEETRQAEIPPGPCKSFLAHVQGLGAPALPILPPPGEPTPGARRVGAPVNELRLQLGTGPAQGFTFGPSLLSEPDTSPHRRLIEDLLDLADSATASGFKVLFRGEM